MAEKSSPCDNDSRTDLQKYESEIKFINSKLEELDKQKASLLQHGYRIEGIVAYLRAKEKKSIVVEKEPV